MGRLVFRMLLLSTTDDTVNAAPVEAGWEVILLLHWTWRDSQMKAEWSLGGSGQRGQHLPLDDIVDIPCSLEEVSLVGCVCRFYSNAVPCSVAKLLMSNGFSKG